MILFVDIAEGSFTRTMLGVWACGLDFFKEALKTCDVAPSQSDLFIDAAKAAGLTIGCVNGKYLITKYSSDDAANRQHFKNLTRYGSKSLSDKYLQTTKQLDSSSDVWWKSDSLLRTLFASQETSQ